MFEIVGSLVLLAIIALYTVIHIVLLAASFLGGIVKGFFRK